MVHHYIIHHEKNYRPAAAPTVPAGHAALDGVEPRARQPARAALRAPPRARIDNQRRLGKPQILWLSALFITVFQYIGRAFEGS